MKSCSLRRGSDTSKLEILIHNFKYSNDFHLKIVLHIDRDLYIPRPLYSRGSGNGVLRTTESPQSLYSIIEYTHISRYTYKIHTYIMIIKVGY